MWAALWLAIAAIASVVLVLEWRRVISFDLSGQRTEGLIAFTPLLALAVAVALLVIGIRAVRPWSEYVARTTPQQRVDAEHAYLRGEASTPPLVIGAVLGGAALAGAVLTGVALPGLPERPAGLLLAIEFVALAAMGSVALITTGVRRRRAARTAVTAAAVSDR